MRWMLAVLLCGCSLYFPSDDTSEERPDAATVPSECGEAIARCTEGQVTLTPLPGEICHEIPTDPVYTCPTACTTDERILCLAADCTTATDLCADPSAAPLPTPFACPGAVDLCGAAVETCAADGSSRCADGLCSAAEVQAALVGTWIGWMVTPWETYPVTLTITADGHYSTIRPGASSAFYYGTDGAGDARRFHVLGQTSVGATALVRIFFGSASVQDGLARGIRVTPTGLTFDLVSSWLECFDYGTLTLTRA